MNMPHFKAAAGLLLLLVAIACSRKTDPQPEGVNLPAITISNLSSSQGAAQGQQVVMGRDSTWFATPAQIAFDYEVQAQAPLQEIKHVLVRNGADSVLGTVTSGFASATSTQGQVNYLEVKGPYLESYQLRIVATDNQNRTSSQLVTVKRPKLIFRSYDNVVAEFVRPGWPLAHVYPAYRPTVAAAVPNIFFDGSTGNMVQLAQALQAPQNIDFVFWVPFLDGFNNYSTIQSPHQLIYRNGYNPVGLWWQSLGPMPGQTHTVFKYMRGWKYSAATAADIAGVKLDYSQLGYTAIEGPNDSIYCWVYECSNGRRGLINWVTDRNLESYYARGSFNIITVEQAP